MSFIYVSDVRYKEKKFMDKIKNFFFFLFKGYDRIHINDEIYDSKFKKIGYIVWMDKKNISGQMSMLQKIVIKNDINLVCFSAGFEYDKSMKNLPVKFTFGDDARFLFLCRRFKKEVEEKEMVGVIIDRKTKESYIEYICKYYPLVIFFTKDVKMGENIASKINKKTGSSIYVTSLDKSLNKMGGIIDLSMDKFSDLKIKTPCLLDFYNNEYFEGEKKLYSFCVKTNGIFTNEKLLNFYSESIIEALVLLKKGIFIRDMFLKKDINAVLTEYKCKLAFNP